MMNHKELFLRAARRNVFQSRFVLLKNSLAKPSCRYLSSVSPLLDDGDHHEDIPREQWMRKKRAMIPTTKELKHRASAALVAVAAPVVDDSSKVDNDSVKNNTNTSPTELTYTGNTTMPITTQLHVVRPGEDTPSGVWPVFRLMDEDGTFRNGENDGYSFPPSTIRTQQSSFLSDLKDDFSLRNLRESLKDAYPLHADEVEQNRLLFPSKYPYADTDSDNTLHRAYTQMVRLREMDKILQNAQRQGRISFYMTCHGEEAIHIGSASALELEDTVLAQYREAGLLMWRGFTLEQFTDQCFSNRADLGKGRQMPVHYGSRALNYQTISSPLGTQIPQAAGAAYRLKLSDKKAVAMCFFGDGCASTIDFHSGLNFAATLKAPVIFFCRNNGYAISTPVTDQYAGDGIISRAPGYGMAAIRIDGNDVFAVHAAVREARKYALENNAPVLIEAMSYRQGHHSTSDDSLRYRSAKEVQSFADNSDPVARLQHFLARHEGMTGDDFKKIEDEQKMAVIDAMRQAERKPKPPLEDMFSDVYHEMPQSLKDQQQELNEHLKKYSKQY